MGYLDAAKHDRRMDANVIRQLEWLTFVANAVAIAMLVRFSRSATRDSDATAA
jgi:hypothetical protein